VLLGSFAAGFTQLFSSHYMKIFAPDLMHQVGTCPPQSWSTHQLVEPRSAGPRLTEIRLFSEVLPDRVMDLTLLVFCISAETRLFLLTCGLLFSPAPRYTQSAGYPPLRGFGSTPSGFLTDPGRCFLVRLSGVLVGFFPRRCPGTIFLLCMASF